MSICIVCFIDQATLYNHIFAYCYSEADSCQGHPQQSAHVDIVWQAVYVIDVQNYLYIDVSLGDLYILRFVLEIVNFLMNCKNIFTLIFTKNVAEK